MESSEAKDTVIVSKSLVKTLGLRAAYALSCLLDWSSEADEDGFFKKAADDCTEEIGLNRYEMTTAQKTLEGAGILEAKAKGIKGVQGTILHYRLNKEAISAQYQIAENYIPRKQDTSPRSKAGWIYVLKCQDRYKIGRAGNLDRRLSYLATLMPLPWCVVHKSHHAYVATIERKIHKRFGLKRFKGEWFYLTKEDLEWFETLTN